MAAPHVSGVAALIWSHFPEKSDVVIRVALRESAIDLRPSGRDHKYGYGFVRAGYAMVYLEETLDPPTPSPIEPRGNSCEEHGDLFVKFGKTANEACYECGGDRTITRQPTSSKRTQKKTEVKF